MTPTHTDIRCRVLAVLCTALLFGCSADAGNARQPFTFVVDVLGSAHALADFEVRVGGGLRDEGVGTRGSRLSRRFRIDGPIWEALLGTQYTVSTSVGRVTVAPFVCDLNHALLSKVAAGWTATESHEVLLGDDGSLELNTDFDRHLWYRCELSKGGDVDGSSWYASTPMRCSEVDRAATRLTLTDAMGVASAAEYCAATHVQIDGGDVFILRASRRTSTGHMLGFHLAVCAPPLVAARRAVVGSDIPDPRCRYGFGSGLSRPDGAPVAEFGPKSGWLEFRAADSYLSRSLGGVDATFGSPDSEVRISGTFDLPTLRLKPRGAE